MSTIEISIIIVSFNTKAMTLEAIRSLSRETDPSLFETIVIDNASSDGSAEAIAMALSDLPNTRFIKSENNLGFAQANNLAATAARGHYLLLLNPDTVIKSNAVGKLLDFAKQRPDAKIWGGRTIFEDGCLNPTNCFREVSLRHLFFRTVGLANLFPASEYFNGETYGRWQRDTEREVEIVTGCFLLIERAFWDHLSGFDPTFFMFGEEADLCMRARRIGARPRVTPTAEIIHHGGASEKVRSRRVVLVLAARITLIRRHFGRIESSLAVFFLVLWPLSRFTIHSILAAFGRQSSRHSAATWGEVWRRRKEWRLGFSPPPRTE
jgi:GT2 family glycosyltransferase